MRRSASSVRSYRPPPLSELARRFDPTALVGHFAFGRSIPLQLDGWARLSLDGWHLVHEPSLPALEVFDSDGTAVGWILGHPLELGRGGLTPPLCLPFAASDPAFIGRFETWLFEHGGQFAAVVVRPVRRVYVDGFASLPVLFDAELELASSSPFLLTTDGSVPDSELGTSLDLIAKGLWFTLGTTAHARADRLLANHYLELDAWRTARHWPSADLAPGDAAAVVEEIGDAIQGVFAAAVADGTPNASLTAGADTRSLLACARPLIDRVSYFTVPFPDELGVVDVRSAPLLARQFGLSCRVLDWVRPTEADVDQFLYQTGCLIGELRGRESRPTHALLSRSGPYISGVGTILSKTAHDLGMFRRNLANRPLDGAWLLRYLYLPPHPELIARADRWLDEAPQLDGHNLRLLFHLEQRYSCWGGALAMAYPEACTSTVYPFGQRAVVEGVMRLPEDYRAAGSARRDLTLSRWPELLDVPVNQPTVAVTVKRKLRRAGHLAQAAQARVRRYGTLSRRGRPPW